MVRIYCRDNHKTEKLCDECTDLVSYAEEKLIRCPFQKEKPVCSKCEIHCYRTDYREKVKEVMRYSGRKMLFKHPKYSLLYLKDKFAYKNATLKNENNKT